MSTDPQTVIAAHADALSNHDPDAVAALFAADCVFVDTGSGQRMEGPDAVRAGAAGLLAMFSDLRIERTSFLTDGTRYTGEWTMTGVHTGDVPGLTATGKSFAVNGACVGRLRDGKIAVLTEYWNMADLLTQVGVMPAMA